MSRASHSQEITQDRRALQQILETLGSEEVPTEPDIMRAVEVWADSDFPAYLDYPQEVYSLQEELMEPWIKASGMLTDEETGERIEFPEEEWPQIESPEWRREFKRKFLRLAQLVNDMEPTLDS